MGWWALPDGCCLGLTACFEAEEGFVLRLPWMHPNTGVFVKGWIVAVLVVVGYGSGGFWRHGFSVRWPKISPPTPVMGVPVLALWLGLVSRACLPCDVPIYPPDITSWWTEWWDWEWAWHRGWCR